MRDVQGLQDLVSRLQAPDSPGATAGKLRCSRLHGRPAGVSGSRQLLLAIARLVAGRLLHRLALQRISSLLSGMHLPTSQEVGPSERGAQPLCHQGHHALWLAGRVRHAAHDLVELDQVPVGEIARLGEVQRRLRRCADLVPAYLHAVIIAADLLNMLKQWDKCAHLFHSWVGTSSLLMHLCRRVACAFIRSVPMLQGVLLNIAVYYQPYNMS
ncbi:uncharacterized protein LOC134542432 isoform X3 [Bacillus rossius redtenbacheri]|uniref:uncharacterized protein LOC134542432 isoform X3 n=1 Tax=Bacillus rossius redtenbacheri TaxID=93214 RepID=UPI002FDDF2B6